MSHRKVGSIRIVAFEAAMPGDDGFEKPNITAVTDVTDAGSLSGKNEGCDEFTKGNALLHGLGTPAQFGVVVRSGNCR